MTANISSYTVGSCNSVLESTYRVLTRDPYPPSLSLCVCGTGSKGKRWKCGQPESQGRRTGSLQSWRGEMGNRRIHVSFYTPLIYILTSQPYCCSSNKSTVVSLYVALLVSNASGFFHFLSELIISHYSWLSCHIYCQSCTYMYTSGSRSCSFSTHRLSQLFGVQVQPGAGISLLLSSQSGLPGILQGWRCPPSIPPFPLPRLFSTLSLTILFCVSPFLFSLFSHLSSPSLLPPPSLSLSLPSSHSSLFHPPLPPPLPLSQDM